MTLALHRSSPFSIRDMQPGDIAAVSELAARIWREHYAPDIVTAEQIEYMLPWTCSVDAIQKQLSEKKQRYWLLYMENTLTGYIGIQPEAAGVWFIDKLYVDTTIQRKGGGTALLTHIIQELRPKALTLRINRKNYKAINFYFKYGFVIEALDVRDIGNGFVMDDFIMRWVA